jgi:hypothetical protein
VAVAAVAPPEQAARRALRCVFVRPRRRFGAHALRHPATGVSVASPSAAGTVLLIDPGRDH